MKFVLWVALLCLIVCGVYDYSTSAVVTPAPAVVAAPAPVAEKKPEPFAYSEAVMPAYVPTPKPRPHQRHRPYCKLLTAKPPVFKS